MEYKNINIVESSGETLAIGFKSFLLRVYPIRLEVILALYRDAFSCCSQYLTIVVTMMETIATVMISMVAVSMVAVSMVAVSMMVVSMVTVPMMVVSMTVMADVTVVPMVVMIYNREIHFMRFEQNTFSLKKSSLMCILFDWRSMEKMS